MLTDTRMKIAHPIMALCATAALAFPATPVLAAKPKAPAKPVLTCKVKTPEGLSYTVIKAGKGERPGDNARVTINYRGNLKSDGSEFDSGQGSKFRVTGVVPGFSQGLKLMQPGGKYRLCIPAALAYGAEENGPVPANSDLVFEVEMLSFAVPPPKPIVPDEARACDLTTASGLSYAIAWQGSGRNPTIADMALVDLTTFDPRNGTILSKDLWEKIPMTSAAPQFAEGLMLMQPGASFRFCFPVSEGPDGEKTPALNIIVDLIDVRAMPATQE